MLLCIQFVHFTAFGLCKLNTQLFLNGHIYQLRPFDFFHNIIPSLVSTHLASKLTLETFTTIAIRHVSQHMFESDTYPLHYMLTAVCFE